jgi:hypothetical protein
VPRPAAAALTALCVGGVTSAFVAPVSLLHTTVPRPGASPQSPLTASAGTEVYLRLGSAASGAYYPVTSVHLSNLAASSPAQVGLSFGTSSLVLLGKVLRAAAGGGRITGVSLALRAPGPSGRPATELVDTFATAVVSSLQENLSGTPAGRVSLVLPAVSDVVSTPGALQHVGPLAPLPAAPGSSAAKAYVTLGAAGKGAPSYAVTAVRLSWAASGAPLDLGFTTSSQPLVKEILRDEGVAVPALTLSVRAGRGGHLTYTFSELNVSSFAENPSGTATLVVRPSATGRAR